MFGTLKITWVKSCFHLYTIHYYSNHEINAAADLAVLPKYNNVSLNCDEVPQSEYRRLKSAIYFLISDII